MMKGFKTANVNIIEKVTCFDDTRNHQWVTASVAFLIKDTVNEGFRSVSFRTSAQTFPNIYRERQKVNMKGIGWESYPQQFDKLVAHLKDLGLRTEVIQQEEWDMVTLGW